MQGSRPHGTYEYGAASEREIALSPPAHPPARWSSDTPTLWCRVRHVCPWLAPDKASRALPLETRTAHKSPGRETDMWDLRLLPARLGILLGRPGWKNSISASTSIGIWRWGLRVARIGSLVGSLTSKNTPVHQASIHRVVTLGLTALRLLDSL